MNISLLVENRPGISGVGPLTTVSLEEICQRVGVPYSGPNMRLAAVLAAAVKRAGVAAGGGGR